MMPIYTLCEWASLVLMDGHYNGLRMGIVKVLGWASLEYLDGQKEIWTFIGRFRQCRMRNILFLRLERNDEWFCKLMEYPFYMFLILVLGHGSPHLSVGQAVSRSVDRDSSLSYGIIRVA